MTDFIIEHSETGNRASCNDESAAHYQGRGWVVVGLTSDPNRPDYLTDAEQAIADDIAAKAVAALNASPEPAPASSDDVAVNAPESIDPAAPAEVESTTPTIPAPSGRLNRGVTNA